MANSACGIGMGSHAELILAQCDACGGGSRIWGDIFDMAGQELVQINGTSNATKYHAKILARHLLLYWDSLGHQKAPHFILLDNNCTPHTAQLVMARLVPAPSSGSLRSRLTWVSWCPVHGGWTNRRTWEMYRINREESPKQWKNVTAN